MRREGIAFGHRTSHTLRITPCSMRHGQVSVGLCEYHNADLMEHAYHSLGISSAKSRYSRREIYEEALRITKVEGCRRTGFCACALGSSARKSLRSRNWSGCYDSSETRHSKRLFLKQLIQEDLAVLS
jgi:hypothetical protein